MSERLFSRAILRRPGPDFAAGLTNAGLGVPEPAQMIAQHAAYARALQKLGVTVEMLEELPGFPDAYFVEDAAVVVRELAVITRPGAPSRRGETAAIEPALLRHRPLARIEAPGTLEGGDVLIAGRTVFIGLSSRTNENGAAQLSRLLAPHGYDARTVPIDEGLHFKTSASWLGGGTLLVTERLAARPELRGFSLLVAARGEELAANVLLVNGTLLAPAGHPQTLHKLRERGLPVMELPMSEVEKMDGGLTCLSLRLE